MYHGRIPIPTILLGGFFGVVALGNIAEASTGRVTLGPVHADTVVRASVISEARSQVRNVQTSLKDVVALNVTVKARSDDSGIKYEARVVITDTHNRLRHSVRAVARVATTKDAAKLRRAVARTATARALQDALGLLK